MGGEPFIQRTCETNPITIIELKEKPECEKVEKVELVTFSNVFDGATTFPQSGSVRKDVDPRGTILEGHKLPVSIKQIWGILSCFEPRTILR